MSILDSNKMVKYRVVGTTHKNPNGTSRQEIISHLTKASKITLVREPDNEYDKNAIAVYANEKQIGYLSSAYAATFAPKIDAGRRFEVNVDTIGSRTSKKNGQSWYISIEIR
ncbi:MAG: hypothetical protein K0Q47_93 [Sedimentibacter sp.]|jgi:single-stranded-DNA-specific exonuclease|nr:hypothetical protein [Sedimentibacter sp.]